MNHPDPEGGQGLEAGVSHDSEMGQPWGSAFLQSRSAVVVMPREGEVPGRGTLVSLLFSSY